MLSVDKIVDEIISGQWERETEPFSESQLSLSGEFEAQYFSNLRRYLQSDLAELVITSGQCLDDLKILKKIKNYNENSVLLDNF